MCKVNGLSLVLQLSWLNHIGKALSEAKQKVRKKEVWFFRSDIETNESRN